MEWFEVQRLLGVDHIQIMDADNPEPVQKVFSYYKDMGLLHLLPYELPGKLPFVYPLPLLSGHDLCQPSALSDLLDRCSNYQVITFLSVLCHKSFVIPVS